MQSLRIVESLFRSLSNSRNFLIFTVFWSLWLVWCSANGDEEAGGAVYLWFPDEYPSLTKSPKLCTGAFRNPPSSICDPDAILSPLEAKALDELIEQKSNKTACLCEPCPPNTRGLNIKVALVHSIGSIGNSSFEDLAENFAKRTNLRWNSDEDKCHNKVLIFVTVSYNKVIILMGSKAENVVEKKEARRMIEETRQHFASNHIYQGLEAIINSIKDRARAYNPRNDRLFFKQAWFLWIGSILLIAFVFIFLAWFLVKRESKSQEKKDYPSNYQKVKANLFLSEQTESIYDHELA